MAQQVRVQFKYGKRAIRGRPIAATIHMAKPDLPNFSFGGRVVFGIIGLIVIVAMLRLFHVF